MISTAKKKALVAGTTALVCLSAAGMAAARGEFYFPPNPAIDTTFAPNYTEVAFKEVRRGMSRADVERLLGKPLQVFEVTGSLYPGLGPGAVEGFTYSQDGACSWGDFAWLGRYVYFDAGGRVTETTQVIHYD